MDFDEFGLNCGTAALKVFKTVKFLILIIKRGDKMASILS